MKYTLPVIAGLMLTQTALAADCGNIQTQQEMNACAAAEYQKADQNLNETYQAILQRATPQQRQLLAEAEQAWIRVRDADCKFVSSGAVGGSAQALVLNQCLTDKTRERINFLSALTQCDEGDLSCPLPPDN
ncbi:MULTISPECIES: lysozyme inhibitor LprI family protein [Tenebrionibacter/Tenebrionicola group]|jgi:uncharacterized protein YecT (DUF1311 family)|uniref:DUF1311 domain-containing protein n=2 Tax=Tenebrionibacter/Tenebrionicola group TaxID=2969848 RepID=A0A8K0Y0J2_9ENTR|nr:MULTISPECIES: lysozyme inhibitor LprI family protein [Tenebrionibacter/Tenebrionicola group]MBK4716674.1 DUF1311 domain-containing protein [Tenebrionibacter intestinalis]MBV5097277.1 DUF1311 domain-containing protein [Tenebrionicola larvae]